MKYNSSHCQYCQEKHLDGDVLPVIYVYAAFINTIELVQFSN